MGFLPALLRLLERHPALLFRVLSRANPYGLIETPALARHFLLWPDISPETLAALHGRMQQESFRMLFDITLLDLPAPQRIRAPVLVLGGGNDRLFPVPEFEATARAYSSRAVIFDNMAHGLMLEPGWEAVADALAAWLDDQGV
jgi:pimeloyl-ACP methyl ester carboxylesterase